MAEISNNIKKERGKQLRNITFKLITTIELVLLPPHDSFGHSLIHPFHKSTVNLPVLGTELGTGYLMEQAQTSQILVWQERQLNRQMLSFEAYLFCLFQTYQTYLSASVMPVIVPNQPPSNPWHLYLSA